MKPIRLSLYCCMLIAFLAAGCGPQGGPSTIQSSAAETVPPATPAGAAGQSASATPAPSDAPPNLLFDDFSYTGQDEMAANGWTIRSKAGWPGVPGATFLPDNVTFLDDADALTNRLLRMTSSTDGSGANTFQTQICHQRKYLEGTYAARVRFSDSPVSGPDGDQVVETLYAITPYEEAMDPAYSEMDFEYLPNGGWGSQPNSFFFTTWETVTIEPWLADNTYTHKSQDMEGWHTLVVQAGNGTVHYYVDGEQVAEHRGNYYPDAPMSINFNLWFTDGGLIKSTEVRTYQEDVDWIFHDADVLLTPEQVVEKVQGLRDTGLDFVDTVPPEYPALDSPCDL